MFTKTFRSLYGFSLSYPQDWGLSLGLERVVLVPGDTALEPYSVQLSTLQTTIRNLDALPTQIRQKLLQLEGAEIQAEKTVQFSGISGTSFDVWHPGLNSRADTSAVAAPKRSFVVGLPLLDGNLTVLMIFSAETEVYAAFERDYIQPILDSFELTEEYHSPRSGYRRLARDGYGVAIDFPEDWLISEFNAREAAFRAMDQRWPINNATLITHSPNKPHPLEYYWASALNDFRITAGVDSITDQVSELHELPAYTIEYTLSHRLGGLNQGQQTLALRPDGLLINLTTLAPQDKLQAFKPIFETMYQDLIIRPVEENRANPSP